MTANDKADKGYVLVTGGAGYIGSHTILEMLTAGFKIIATDNFANAIRGKLISTADAF